jgi:hypothetical protein
LLIEKIGELVEDQETLMTNSIENVYIKKSKEVKLMPFIVLINLK